MYPNPNVLVFPSLVRIPDQQPKPRHPVVEGCEDDFIFRKDGEEEPVKHRSIPLYRLDWRLVDEAKVKAHEAWMDTFDFSGERGILSDKLPVAAPRVPFTPLVNLVWSRKLDNLTFAVPEPYGYEIWKQTERAKAEWGRNLPFNGVVCDRCLDTARSSIGVAFYLLMDCIWNADSSHPQGWDREANKQLFQSVMLTRFWDGQTAETRIYTYAEFQNLNIGSLGDSRIPRNPEREHVLFFESYQAQLKMRAQLEEPFRTAPSRLISGGPWATKPRMNFGSSGGVPRTARGFNIIKKDD